MPIVQSFYELAVECDLSDQNNKCSHTAVFIGTNMGSARKSGRKAGWKIRQNGTVLCPLHAQKELKQRKKNRKNRNEKSSDNKRTDKEDMGAVC